jgi:hypothetical protein
METLITWLSFLVILGFGTVVVLLRFILDELRLSNRRNYVPSTELDNNA